MMRREGFGRGAHGGVVGDLSMLGDGLVTTNRSTTAVGAEDEDAVDDGAPGPPASCGSSERAGASLKSSGARRRGSEMAVAVVELVGGDGCVRSRSGKGLEGEGESRE